MKKRKINKKNLIILLSGLIVIILSIVILGYMIIQSNKHIIFLVEGKESTSYKKTIEFERDLELNTKVLKVKAQYDGKDVSNKIVVKPIKVNQLKTYSFTYKIKDYKGALDYKVKVVDTTAPVITGKNVYEIQEGEEFGLAQLELVLSDNFDEDFTNKITLPPIDTSLVKEYALDVIVVDSSKNKSVYPITLKVNKKIVAPVANNKMDIPKEYNVVGNPNSVSVLVNKNNRLPDGWAPSDLVGIGGNHSLRSEAANAWNSLASTALNEGIAIRVISTYRSQSYQQNLYNAYYAQDPQGAPFYSALARTSEHELGLAIDISYDSVLHNDLQSSTLGVWMANNAHNYGFIMRYPYDKTDVTQYMFEPWHYRYVGIAMATEIKNRNICLEEY